jgi:polar amino acid transport system substrate-binding protein
MRSLRAPLAGLLALTLCACQSLSELIGRSSSTRVQTILESQELRVGLTGSQPPLNMRDKQGEIIGLDVDLANELAQSMGLEARFVTMPFAELLPALERDELDLVISGLTITPERNARVAFAGPYFISGKSILTKSETVANAEDTRVLDDPAFTFAALASSTSERFIQSELPSAQLIATPDYDTAVRMVIKDEVDALIADFPICALSVLRFPEAGFSSLMTPFTVEPLGIALPADDPLLINLVQNYLTTIEETGLLTRFKAKWFSQGSWVSELP